MRSAHGQSAPTAQAAAKPLHLALIPHPGLNGRAAISPLVRALLGAGLFAVSGACRLAAQPWLESLQPFIDAHCAACHDDVERKGNLDLTASAQSLADPATRDRWVLALDRVRAGEMPPARRKRPPAAEAEAFLATIAGAVTTHEKTVEAREGRTTQRRLNRYEVENALRDLLEVPALEVKDELPEDGEARHFNKIGDALDVSHVQMTRYLRASQAALRQVLAVELAREELPAPSVRRFYAREEPAWTRTFRPGRGGATNLDRMAFPVLGFGPQPELRSLKGPREAPVPTDPATRELEAVGWMRGNYHPFHTVWNNFRAPAAGRYRVRWNGYTIWVGPNGSWTPLVDRIDGKPAGDERWYAPNGDDVTAGRRDEPITIYAQGSTQVRRLGSFDLTPQPQVHDLGEVELGLNEALVTDASRFFRNRPGYAANPLAQRDGAPAVAFRWMEIEGPLTDGAPTPGYRRLFGDLPLRRATEATGRVRVTALLPSNQRGAQAAGGYGSVVQTTSVPVEVVSADPTRDAEHLLRAFMQRAYRRPVAEEEVQLYLGVIARDTAAGRDFTTSLLAGYTAVLCSPGFLFVEENVGRLNDHALATRLAFFLTNSPPDEQLRAHADRGDLRRTEVLRAETERLVASPRASRFITAFLDYWLDLRKYDATTPSNTLYPDYYLDEALVEAALDESRLFFAELVQRDLPIKHLIAADFTFANERLAEHYGIPGVTGGAMRRVALPAGHVRGGVLTQAIVLKVTANGTTTSPVLRGVWIAERLLGLHISPPPSSVGAVDPDTRGAVTIRQQLDQHRADPSCMACHVKIDPPGFALESFDVMGGWRDRYRGDRPDAVPEIGIGKNGLPFAFHFALPVDSHGALPTGETFTDVQDFKRLVLQDERQLAQAFLGHLVVFATAAPVRFSDRPAIERILMQTAASGYGVRDLIHALVQSDLFQTK